MIMHLTCHAATLLGTITFASGLVGDALRGIDPPNGFVIEWQPEGSNSGSGINEWNQEQYSSPPPQLETTSYQELDEWRCISCCTSKTEECPEYCSCWKTLQIATPRVGQTATQPEPLEPATGEAPTSPGLFNQRCSPTFQKLTAAQNCPYPCERSCPCFDYCISAVCFLIAWDYDPGKYPCVSEIELL